VPHAGVALALPPPVSLCCGEKRVTELVLAGGIRRPSLLLAPSDRRAAKLFARIGYRALGDNGLLSAVVAELEHEGFG